MYEGSSGTSVIDPGTAQNEEEGIATHGWVLLSNAASRPPTSNAAMTVMASSSLNTTFMLLA